MEKRAVTLGLEHVHVLLDNMFHNERRQILYAEETLIQQNHMLGGYVAGFRAAGAVVSIYQDNAKILQRTSKQHQKVDDSLAEEAQLLIYRRKTYERDFRITKQLLQILLRDCTTDQEIRDALPENMVRFLPNSVKVLERDRKPGWPFETKPMLKPQFCMLEEKALYYFSNEYLY